MLIRRALASSVTAEIAISVEGRGGAAASLCPPVVALCGCDCMREQFAVAFWRRVCSFRRPLFTDGCLFALFEARVTFGARDREGRASCGDYGVPVEPVAVAIAFKLRRLSVVGYLSERHIRCPPGFHRECDGNFRVCFPERVFRRVCHGGIAKTRGGGIMCGFIRAHCCDIMWIVVSEHPIGVAYYRHSRSEISQSLSRPGSSWLRKKLLRAVQLRYAVSCRIMAGELNRHWWGRSRTSKSRCLWQMGFGRAYHWVIAE